MRIITHQCPACHTIVAANVLEEQRVMKCPNLTCDNILRFEDLPAEEREYYLDNSAQYLI